MYSPIYSVDTECQDCYKCVRHCPVKAIHVEHDHASVAPEKCIMCGKCVNVCEHGAKQVRSDLEAVRLLLLKNSNVRASVAPSFVSEFPGVSRERLFAAIKSLGFAGVHETADGAEQVSKEVAKLLDSEKRGVFISTACPVAVELIRKYYPQWTPSLTPVLPPMMAHCRMLKKKFGENTKIVFFGPCIAKKNDADKHPESLEYAITFEMLRKWFETCGIDLGENESGATGASLRDTGNVSVVVEKQGGATIGALYPVEGGMNRTTKAFLKRGDMGESFITLCGVKHIAKELERLDPEAFDRPVFLELLACEGGCIAGPKSVRRSVSSSRLRVTSYAGDAPSGSLVSVDSSTQWIAEPIERPAFPEERIAEVLASLGKRSKADELNCGGCGYDSCRALAEAILRKDAEPQMCVSHMRQIAQRKSNAISQALPYGIAVINSSLEIVEANERFAKMFGEGTKLMYEANPGMKGAKIEKIIPVPSMFNWVLATGKEIIRKNVRVDEHVYSISIFNIEAGSQIGLLTLDISDTELKRQKIIENSRMVIENTTKTVQEVAYRLGKSSAESELILNDMMSLFAAQDIVDPDDQR